MNGPCVGAWRKSAELWVDETGHLRSEVERKGGRSSVVFRRVKDKVESQLSQLSK